MAPPGPATHLLPPLVLALAGVARGSFTVVARPRVAAVAFGGSVAVNCSRSPCDKDDVAVTLETPGLAATPGPAGRLWKSFRLENVSRWEPGDVTCAGRCGDTEDRDSVGVIVYQPPQRVTLDPVTPVAEGDGVTLRCHVLGAAPLRHLTVTLRRGAETLRTATFGDNDNDNDHHDVAVSHLLTVTRADHGQDVTCHAELSLRPHGPLFARAAVPVALSVFALPDPPQLLSPSILEVGTVTNVTCLVTGAFPAGDVGVTAALDREPLDVTVEVTGDTVRATAVVAPGRTGRRELSCTATVATVTRTTRRWLRVYSFPEPTLELSPPTAPEGTEVTVTCRAGDTEMALLGGRDVTETSPTLLGGRDVTGVTEMSPTLLGVQDVTGVTEMSPTLLGGQDVTGVTEMSPTLLGGQDVTGVTEMSPTLLGVRDVTGVTPAEGHQADVTKPPMALLGVRDVTSVTPAEGHQADVTEVPPMVLRVQDVTGVTEMSPTLLGVRDVTGVTETPRALLGVRDVTGVTPAEGHQADVPEVPPTLLRVQDVTSVPEVPPALLRVGDVTNVTLAEGHQADVTKVPPTLLRVGDVTNVTLAEGRGPQLQLRVVARRDRERFWCRATIDLGDKEVTKEVTARLDVLYPPELPSGSCPGSRTWLRGSVAALSCRATGNPVPVVTCRRRAAGATGATNVTAGVTGATTGATIVTTNVTTGATRVTTGATKVTTGDTNVTAGATTGATTGVTTGATTGATTGVTTGATTGTTNVTTWATTGATKVTTQATKVTTEVITKATTEVATEVTMEPLPVTRDRAGTYVCKATNALGTRSRRVTVRVEYPPSLSESGCPSRRVWVEGQRRHLECHGDGDPPPRTRCHRDGGTRDGDVVDGGIQDGAIQDGGNQYGGNQDGGIQYGGTQDGGIQDGGNQDGGIQDGRNQHGRIQDGGIQDGGTQDGGAHDGDIRDGDTHRGDTHHSDTHKGDTHHSDTHNGDTHRHDTHGVTHRSDTHDGDTHRHDTHGDTHHGVTQPRGVTHHSDTRRSGAHNVTHHSDTHDGDTHLGGTHGVTHGGVTHDSDTHGGVTQPRGVTQADGGRYVCRATNRHGVAVRSVVVTVEAPPRLSERGCPRRRRWLEGTRARLSCAASGNPPPRVTCRRLGDSGHPGDLGGAGERPRDVIGVGERPRDVIGVGEQNYPGDVIKTGDKSYSGDVIKMEDNRDRPHDVIGMGGQSHPGDVIKMGHQSHPDDVIRMSDQSHPDDVIKISDQSHPDDVIKMDDNQNRPHDVIKMGGQSHPGDVIKMSDSRNRPHDVIGLGDQSHPDDVIEISDKNHPDDVIKMSDSWDRPHDVIGLGDQTHPDDVIETSDQSHPDDVIGLGDQTHPDDVIETSDQSHPDDVIETSDQSHPDDVIETSDQGHPDDVIERSDQGHPDDVIGPRDTRGHPWASPNVTRGDAGVYRCRASNAHGTALRDVAVTVEYPPSAVTLRVLPSAAVPRGVTVTVTCSSRGVPGVAFAWSHPGAANLRLSRDNSSVTVTGVTAANRGLYTCTASNRHGRSTGSVTVTVDDTWLVALVALGTLGIVTVLALAVAGLLYLKSTACKKGEYNVRDAEGSSEATCLHRGDTGDDAFGIQLTQT